MSPSISFSIISSLLVCVLALLSSLVTTTNALPVPSRSILRRGIDLPITVKRNVGKLGRKRDGSVSGDIGLGDNADLLYTVPIELGKTTTAVHLDTGSSDLWVITDQCTTGTCVGASATRYPSSAINSSGISVTMQYGDSQTGTSATGPIAFDTAVLAGVAIENQAFSAASVTTNPTITYGAAGILGLGFPAGSDVQEQLVTTNFGPIKQTDDFLKATWQYGPTLSRMSMTGALAEPRFTIALQRDTIGFEAGDSERQDGTLSIGKLPDGVTDDDLTWVPIRLYRPEDGGLSPPAFAPNETYPFRWEIDIDAVFLDGKQLPASTIPATGGVDTSKVSALIDTGNSLIRGPKDVVTNILSTVSGKADNTLPCNIPHTLSFQIGGKLFPVNPLDFITQSTAGNAQTCVASNIVSTDAPSFGALFQWSLGDPFMKSNIVTFHYGNLTHPSVDPPKIGLKSIVPTDAAQDLNNVVAAAQKNNGNFESTFEAAPTAQAAAEGQVTIAPGSNQVPSTTAAPPTVTSQPPEAAAPPPPPANNAPPAASPTDDSNGNLGAGNSGALSAHASGVWLSLVVSILAGTVSFFGAL